MRLLQKLLDNPIFIKERRIGFREKKLTMALIGWVLFMSFFTLMIFLSYLPTNHSSEKLAEAGHNVFEAMFWLQLLSLGVLIPSLTTSSISSERERNTLETLLLSPISPQEIVAGKLGFAACFIFLALSLTLPVQAIVFFFGGVSLANFLGSEFTLIICCFLASTLGLLASASESRSSNATTRTYAFLALCSLFVLPFLGYLRFEETVSTQVIAFAVITSVYLIIFFFWKAVNGIEQKALNLKILRGATLIYYVLFLALILSSPSLSFKNAGLLFCFYIFNYVLFGTMLNPTALERHHEQKLFSQSLWSNPLSWCGVLSIGTILAALSISGSIHLAIFTVLVGLSCALFARGLAQTFPGRYALALGTTWLLTNILPLLTIDHTITEQALNTHPATISPYYYFVRIADLSATGIPYAAYVTYTVVLLLGLIMLSPNSKRAVAKASSS